MKIAICVCPVIPVPPPKYGGVEMLADMQARLLAERGHEVVLLCGPDSTYAGQKVMATAQATNAAWEHVSWLRSHNDFDCIIDASSNHLPSQDKGLPKGAKTLAFMYGDPYKKYPHNGVRNRVYRSKTFAEFNKCPNHPVIDNIPTDRPQDIPLGDGSGNYCLYVGTVRPEKGVHLAASACRRLDIPLKVAGPVQPRFAAYWDTFKSGVDYVGEVGKEKWELMGKATALLFPSLWCDAGSLVVKEALVCGTPVLACPNGGVIEDINESNGLLIEPKEFTIGLHNMINAQWDRAKIQADAVKKFDPVKYITDLEALVTRVSNGETW